MSYVISAICLVVLSLCVAFFSVKQNRNDKSIERKHSQDKKPFLDDNQTELQKVKASLRVDSTVEHGSSSFQISSPLSAGVISPVGYSEQDVLRLDDFPDYAQITGVPLPQPYHTFKIETAKPRPYRPLRWMYHQTMCKCIITFFDCGRRADDDLALTKLEPDWWLELESTYKDRIRQRLELFDKHGTSILNALPGSELACKELLGLVIQFLRARYPHYFTFDTQTCLLENKILDRTYSTKEMNPLHIILNNVPEDFLIVLKNPETEKYHLRAGVCCSSIGWNLGTKIGKSLAEIHAPVPDYKEKMSMSMDRFFSKLPSDKPIQRGSWGLEAGQPLFIPQGDPHWQVRSCQSPTLEPEDIHMRVDWQTLRRLPVSNAIVFNFKCLFTPITEFRDEPGVPGLLLKILKEGKRHLMDDKGTWHVEHVAIPVLETYKEEQENLEVIDRSSEISTLPETPFYPGWQTKWKTRQGF